MAFVTFLFSFLSVDQLHIANVDNLVQRIMPTVYSMLLPIFHHL